MALVAIGAVSCAPSIAENPQHEIESLEELFDSLSCRGFDVKRIIRYNPYGVNEEYRAYYTIQDSIGVDTIDIDAWYKRMLEKSQSY